jgi:hypothetical protein
MRPPEFSMADIWDKTVAFVLRERAVLVPIWLALLSMGDFGRILAFKGFQAGGQNDAGIWPVAAFFLCLVVSALGQLAVTFLVLRENASIAESLGAARDALGRYLIIGLAGVILFMVITLPLMMGLAISGVDLMAAQPKLPRWAQIYGLGVFTFILWLSVRMVTLMPMLLATKEGAVGIVRAAFRQTRGAVARIFGVMLVYMLVALLVSQAVTASVGILLKGLGLLLDQPQLGSVLTDLLGGFVSGGLSLVSTVFIAELYRAFAKS